MSDMKNSGEEEEHTCSYSPVIMEVLHDATSHTGLGKSGHKSQQHRYIYSILGLMLQAPSYLLLLRFILICILVLLLVYILVCTGCLQSRWSLS